MSGAMLVGPLYLLGVAVGTLLFTCACVACLRPRGTANVEAPSHSKPTPAVVQPPPASTTPMKEEVVIEMVTPAKMPAPAPAPPTEHSFEDKVDMARVQRSICTSL